MFLSVHGSLISVGFLVKSKQAYMCSDLSECLVLEEFATLFIRLELSVELQEVKLQQGLAA